MNIKNITMGEERSLLIIKDFNFEKEALYHTIYKFNHLGIIESEFSEFSCKLILDKKNDGCDMATLSQLISEEIESLNNYYISKENIQTFKSQTISPN